MEDSLPGDITLLLKAWGEGDREALERLVPLVYPHLRRLARALVHRESHAHALEATVLVHDLYLTLYRQRKADFNDRQHFYSVAAGVMRRILRDHARHRHAQRRGPEEVRVPLSDDVASTDQADEEVLDLDRALDELAALEPRKAQLVELTAFLGCSTQEAADVLKISKATADRDLRFARAWLRERLDATRRVHGPTPSRSKGE
jgi:RNA polymerase sigma factor (TIGR02999 family)